MARQMDENKTIPVEHYKSLGIPRSTFDEYVKNDVKE
jgi:hypothetical protein